MFRQTLIFLASLAEHLLFLSDKLMFAKRCFHYKFTTFPAFVFNLAIFVLKSKGDEEIISFVTRHSKNFPYLCN